MCLFKSCAYVCVWEEKKREREYFSFKTNICSSLLFWDVPVWGKGDREALAHHVEQYALPKTTFFKNEMEKARFF